MTKRIFDIIFSFAGLIFLAPLFVIITILIAIDSKGGVVYKQIRVGKNNQDFFLFKFRTMFTNASQKGFLTVGNRDSRITRVGYYLRKYKLDELPQLFNVLKGDMSIVGPRPEVRKFVDLYTKEQMQVLFVKPGITDYASIEYVNENELLAQSQNPEKIYIEEIMPAKLKLNQKYIQEQSLFIDLKIIIGTLKKIMNG